MNDSVALLQELLVDGNWIQFPVKLLRVMTPNEAVMLSELINRWKTVKAGDGGFFYSEKQIEERLSMDRHAQQRVLKKLKDAGLIRTQSDGFPRRRVIFLEWNAIASVFADSPENAVSAPVAAESQQLDSQSQRKCCNSRSGSAATVAAEVLHPLYERKSKEKTNNVAPGVRCGTTEHEGLFSPSDRTAEKTTSRGKDCAAKLYEGLQARGKIMRPPNLRNWSKSFDQIFKFRPDDEDRILQVLDWYVDHIGDEFIPEAYSASSFVDKFLKIEQSMKRQSKNRQSEEGRNGKGTMTDEEILAMMRGGN